jgi:hypothetical protein
VFADDLDAVPCRGVTALPATQSSDPDPDWVCENSDCGLYGVVLG